MKDEGGFAFASKRCVTTSHRMNLRAVKEGRVVVVDGNQMFNRPGPR